MLNTKEQYRSGPLGNAPSLKIVGGPFRWINFSYPYSSGATTGTHEAMARDGPRLESRRADGPNKTGQMLAGRTTAEGEQVGRLVHSS